MLQKTKVIGGRKFVVNCEDFLSPQAQWLLELCEDLDGKSRINHGMKIQVGWTILTALEQGDAVEIAAPNYDTNPFTETSEDLSVSLSVQAAQNLVLKKLNVDGEATLFQDKIIAAKGAIDLERVYLERSKQSAKGDSGWYLGPVEGSDENLELEAYYVYQLLKRRPSLLKALAIPRGYLVVFNEENIEAVVDENDANIWQNTGE